MIKNSFLLFSLLLTSGVTVAATNYDNLQNKYNSPKQAHELYLEALKGLNRTGFVGDQLS